MTTLPACAPAPFVARLDPGRWLRWTATFVGFPLAGLAARAAVGPVDGRLSALVGGLTAGSVLGAVQSLALPTGEGRTTATTRLRWAAATAVGMAIGLLAGATGVGFRTDTASLVVMGALTGAGVGIAQAAVLTAVAERAAAGRRIGWAALTAALWALGWAITAQVISDVEAQYANFGASGALVAAGVGGVVVARWSRADPCR